MCFIWDGSLRRREGIGNNGGEVFSRGFVGITWAKDLTGDGENTFDEGSKDGLRLDWLRDVDVLRGFWGDLHFGRCE